MKNQKILTFPIFFIYFNSSLQAFLFALTLPTLSYFIAEKFSADAFYIGLFFILISLSSILFSQLMGHFSDRLNDRRPLILLGMLCGSTSCYLFSISSSYEIALISGVSFFSLSFASIPQTFAHARDYAGHKFNRKNLIMFNTILRACSAFSWVGGPAIGFLLIDYFNFKQYYLIVALMYLACATSTLLTLPKVQNLAKKNHKLDKSRNKQITIAFIGFSLIFGCNQSYLISLPLYITQVLNLDVSWSGWLMGTAAAIEIPIMIFAGWLGTRFSLPSLICIGSVASITLYFGFWHATELWVLFPLQICNALMIGFVAGLGMTWFQDLMPDRAGAASALFWNTTNVGNILGAITIAFFAQLLGYRDVYLINTAMAIMATILLIYVARASKNS